MKIKELQTKELADLKDILVLKREKLRELRFKDSNKQLKNVREIRATRQEIAKILTVVNQKNKE